MKKLGLVSIWFERGQTYVGLNLLKALEKHYEVFIFARQGVIGNMGMFSDYGEFKVQNLSPYPSYEIPPDILKFWIEKNKLDAVILLEEQWQKESLLQAVKETGALAIGLPMQEFIFDEKAYGDFKDYDFVICPTKLTFDRLSAAGLTNCVYVRWGDRSERFIQPDTEVRSPIRFFHPAGWGGVHGRRNTQAVVDAFTKIADKIDARLLVHMQTVNESRRGEALNGKIKIEERMLAWEELAQFYSRGHIAVLPTKWSGIELTIIEAQHAGLAVITVDAPPMNEWIISGKTGLLASVKDRKTYPGIGIQSAEVDVDQLSDAMLALAQDPIRISTMREASLVYAQESLNWHKNSQVLIQTLEEKLREGCSTVNA